MTETTAHPPTSWAVLVTGALALALPGCATFQTGLPSEPLPSVVNEGVARDLGSLLARSALDQVGVPYRYGGAEPARGFDCSGLVTYVHEGAGIRVPRTAAAQFAAARKVPSGDLHPGDLVFFRLAPRDRAVTHVGIYTGRGRFVHAPQTGRNVSEALLDDDYYRERFAGSGRLYESSEQAAPRRSAAPR